MSALYDGLVAAEDPQEFAHDHAPEIIREMLLINQVVTDWEQRDRHAFGVMNGYGGVHVLEQCIKEIREAMA